MKDELGLDGMEVKKTEKGFLWNNLILNPICIKDETIEVDIPYQEIGIIANGSLFCE